MFSPGGRGATAVSPATVPVAPARRIGPANLAPLWESLAADVALEALAPRRTLRVAHFSDTYLPRRDGVVTALQTLTGAMDELGHESLLVVPKKRDMDVADGLLGLRSLPCGVAQFRLAAWPRSLHVEQVGTWLPHVIHVHTPGPVGLLGVLTARRLGLPLVQTYHTDLHAYADAYRVPSKVISGIVRAYARRLGARMPRVPRGLPRRARRRALVDIGCRLLLGDAKAVLVPTPAVLERDGLPVGQDRMFVAPAGVQLAQVEPDAGPTFRAEHGIGERDRMVLFVGRVNREKGIDLLIDAFGRMAQEVPEAKLVLVGAVYEQRWLGKLMADAGIQTRTIWTGQLPPEQVAGAYHAADVFAFPSLTDTQGLVLQEAALAGVPAVLADPALHGSGPLKSTGVLAGSDPLDYAEALRRLLVEDDRRRELGRAAQQRAEQNTPAKYAQRMAAVYSRVVR